MSYVSIVEKIDEKITNLTCLAFELDHDYNYNIGSGGVCQWYEISCLKKKKEKILNNLMISVEKSADIHDEGGYCIFSEYVITVNGKQHVNVFYEGDILPDGSVISFQTVNTKLKEVAQYYV